ncbi:major facilitator superfamily domain-containing protein [Microdochium trichocladiopsis]|uniref:Major facilitator superfamily domain-containing protein n=1 Tax=Microdochium trichocladiopsis TaxID=1682393 RepID=A0A9P8Y593_9PEZI|nr:major facilitator superfamily domain-containing protein [Microdochium trichocladiopsis]KAH7029822.1 major facilitator superfamily domain-containing protein [Microdochium trichocladiopsis]
MATVVALDAISKNKLEAAGKEGVVVEILPLGVSRKAKRFLWEKSDKTYDPDDTATLPSVFDDPQLAGQYQPPENWENIHRFNPDARWTWREDDKLMRKVDLRIMIWCCVMFIGLEIDRANIQQAMSDNFLQDLGMISNDFNLGQTVFALSFLCAELPSQLVSKWAGPDRWIPAQLTLWSLVATCQFWLSGRSSFLACRALLGLLQGGFIPDIILYLSYFYKHSEMAIRLSFFWLSMTLADIVVAFLAAGILRMRGVLGYAGWRWMFLIEGLLTLVIGLLSFGMMPAGPTETKGWLRGKNGWFTPREEEIIVNRVIRDDPTKSSMHNRERITLSLLWKSICDYHLWPFYLFAFSNFLPIVPPKQYLVLSLRTLGFDVLHTNLLSIPNQVLGIITMLGISWLAERTGRPVLALLVPQFWALPFLIWLRVGYTAASNPWAVWAVMTVLCSAPLTHPIIVSLVSRNSNAVRSRTVSAALYNMCVQAGAMIGVNVYRTEDAPLYRVGNTALLVVIGYNIVIFTGAWFFYRAQNQRRDRVWTAMSEDEKAEYIVRNAGAGNKRLDFRFSH